MLRVVGMTFKTHIIYIYIIVPDIVDLCEVVSVLYHSTNTTWRSP